MCRVSTDRKAKMKQQNLAMAADRCQGFEQCRKPTWCDTYLRPCRRSCLARLSGGHRAAQPYIAGNGRPLVGLERMPDPWCMVHSQIVAILADRFSVFHTPLHMESGTCRHADEIDSFTAPAKTTDG
jgi:hypothetical protein